MDETTRRVLDRARSYVEMETPSGDEAGCRAFAARLGDDLTAAGAGFIDRIRAPGLGDHVLATFAGADGDAAPLMVLGHLDTVHAVGTVVDRPYREEDGRAYGPGLYDMKGPIALIADALHELAEAGRRPRRPLRMLITCDEEIGSDTSRELIVETARACEAVLVAEPPLPEGGAKTARKGVGTYRLAALGVAAHAGIEPEKGASAVVEIARQVLALGAIADPERGTTVTVGRVGGGSASNVVPERAWAEIDVRATEAAEAERVEAALRALEPGDPRVQLRVTVESSRPPLVRTEAVAALYQSVAALAREDGWTLEEGRSGGGSDGCFTGAAGVATLDGLGLPGGGAHAVDEHVRIDDVARRHALWTRMLTEL